MLPTKIITKAINSFMLNNCFLYTNININRVIKNAKCPARPMLISKAIRLVRAKTVKMIFIYFVFEYIAIKIDESNPIAIYGVIMACANIPLGFAGPEYSTCIKDR